MRFIVNSIFKLTSSGSPESTVIFINGDIELALIQFSHKSESMLPL